jgi:hypothetical protein
MAGIVHREGRRGASGIYLSGDIVVELRDLENWFFAADSKCHCEPRSGEAIPDFQKISTTFGWLSQNLGEHLFKPRICAN